MQIKICNLTKKYSDILAVNDISFTVNSNEIFAILGINGAGKTTTIKMMTGLTFFDNGDIFYGDLSMTKNAEEIKKFINISPQETAIADNLTVKENLTFIASVYGNDKKSASAKSDEIIAQFNLLEMENKRAKLLSGGMKRRLSIAMALVSQPQILFLDEPTLGLDVIARAELWKLISSLKEKMTIILTTHYMEEAENLADRVAVMDKGEIILLDTPKNIIQKTQTQSLEQAFIKTVQGGIQ